MVVRMMPKRYSVVMLSAAMIMITYLPKPAVPVSISARS